MKNPPPAWPSTIFDPASSPYLSLRFTVTPRIAIGAKFYEELDLWHIVLRLDGQCIGDIRTAGTA
jgi:hypothetical protein